MALRDDLVQLFYLTDEAAQAQVGVVSCPRLHDWLVVLLGRDPGLLTLQHPWGPIHTWDRKDPHSLGDGAAAMTW